LDTAAAGYSDTKGHWAEEAIDRWTEQNVLKGYDDGTFRPDQTVSRAELAAILNRMLNYPAVEEPVSGMNTADWFYDDVAALLNQRYIYAPDGNFNTALTREEAVYMIGRAFGVDEGIILANGAFFSDHDDISPYAINFITDMRAEKFIIGYPDGSFLPKNTISRAEVITILDKMIDVIIAAPGEYSFYNRTHILVTSPGVTIHLTREPDIKYSYSSRIFISPSVSGENAVTVLKENHSVRIFIVGYSRDVVSYTKENPSYDVFTNLSNNTNPVVSSTRPKAERMAIAMGAMLNYINGAIVISSSVAEFRILPTTFGGARGGADKLQGWNIYNREDLLNSIHRYTTDGNHNDMFQSEAAEIAAMTEAQIEYNSMTYSDGYMFQQLRDWGNKWGDTGIVAWDLFRIANLVFWGYNAGYITYDEALELVEPAAEQVAQHFDTWEEAYDNYLDGYAWWSRSDISDGRPREAEWNLMNAFYPDVFDNQLLS